MKKIFAVILVIGLGAAFALSGTTAYLTSHDADVNVMTTGNVDIEQIEEQLAADGASKEPFVQGKDFYPGTEISKIVSVKNTGKSDAYFRTLIAFEDVPGSETFGVNFPIDEYNGYKWSWGAPEATIVLDGVTYQVYEALYTKVLNPGETSPASLTKVELAADSTNEDMEVLGDEYKILVLSQAVQTEGFDKAETALDTAFGDVNVENCTKWFGGVLAEDAAPTAPANNKAVYNGTTYDTIYEAVAAANANGGGEIKLMGSATLDKPVEIAANITINGNVDGKSAAFTRADSFTGTMLTVGAGASLTLENVIADGGAVWEGETDPTLGRGTTNSGITATGNIIAASNNSSIVLGKGAVLQNNVGAHAINLGTRIGAILTMKDGSKVINNQSDSGAIWGGGNITMYGGEISGNSSTGIGGAIRMVSNCNLTMNGGEICNNKAAGDGGAIWGYGSSTYNFNGGKMSGNESAGTGGAIYTGTYSVINISGDFEMCDNKAANSGAIRLTDHTSMNMTGGKVAGNAAVNYDAIYGWDTAVNLNGGEFADEITIDSGLTPTIGAANITGVVNFSVHTNHNTVNLAKDFNTFKFTVDEGRSNFTAFNFKPAAGYTYTAGDEAKLVCMNEGYSTYWDAATGTFRLTAN